MDHKSEPSEMSRVDVMLAGKFFRARCQAQLGVLETAIGLGMSLSDYAAHERAEQRIAPEMVVKMSRLTGHEISWFYQSKDKMVDGVESGMDFDRHAAQEILESYSKELGMNKFYLEVRESNCAAISFYLKLGFVVTHTRKSSYSDGESALVMVKGIEL